ncbi:hypothetical protein MKX03_010000 [Papaver bracteatum]|nr:hypothetical protein MKX03_010000 [Papaver bracteatum]
MQRNVLVDGKVRTDKTYPYVFMDVVLIPKTNENFCVLYDKKGCFRLHSIKDEEVKVNLFTPFFYAMLILMSLILFAILNCSSVTNMIITAKYHASVQLNTY